MAQGFFIGVISLGKSGKRPGTTTARAFYLQTFLNSILTDNRDIYQTEKMNFNPMRSPTPGSPSRPVIIIEKTFIAIWNPNKLSPK